MADSSQEDWAQEDWARLGSNLLVEAALLRVLDLLEDLPVVVFKGPVLTRMVYGDLRRRVSGDNDLWVRPSHSKIALSRLLKDGYRPSEGLDPGRALARVGQVALRKEGSDDTIWVDLHEHPFARRFFSVDENTLRAHLIEVELHGRKVTTFDRPLAFCHMVAHYMQHRFEEEKLAVLAAAWDTWELAQGQLLALAERTCTAPVLEFALGILDRRGLASRQIPVATHFRARRALQALDPFTPEETHPLVLKALQLALALPRDLPQTALRSVLLEQDDLEYRYGKGPYWRLTSLHLKFLLRKSP